MRIRYGTYSDFKTCKIPKVNNFDKLLKTYKRFITCIFNMFLMNKKKCLLKAIMVIWL